METNNHQLKWILLSCFFLFCFQLIQAQQFGNLPGQWCYAIKIKGLLCGYSDSHLSFTEQEGKGMWHLNDTTMVKLSVLQGGVDMTIISHSLIDPMVKQKLQLLPQPKCICRIAVQGYKWSLAGCIW